MPVKRNVQIVDESSVQFVLEQIFGHALQVHFGHEILGVEDHTRTDSAFDVRVQLFRRLLQVGRQIVLPQEQSQRFCGRVSEFICPKHLCQSVKGVTERGRIPTDIRVAQPVKENRFFAGDHLVQNSGSVTCPMRWAGATTSRQCAALHI